MTIKAIKQREDTLVEKYRGDFKGFDVQIYREGNELYSMVISEPLDKGTNVSALINPEDNTLIFSSFVLANPRSLLEDLTRKDIVEAFTETKELALQGRAA